MSRVKAWVDCHNTAEPRKTQPSGLPPMIVCKPGSDIQRLRLAATTGRFLMHDWLVFLRENNVPTGHMNWICSTICSLQHPVEGTDMDDTNELAHISVAQADQYLSEGIPKLHDDLVDRGHGEWCFLSWVSWAGREDMLHIVLTGITDVLSQEDSDWMIPPSHWTRLHTWRQIMASLTDWRFRFIIVDWKHDWENSATKVWTQAAGALDSARREVDMTWATKMEGYAQWVKADHGVFEDGVRQVFGLEVAASQEAPGADLALRLDDLKAGEGQEDEKPR